MEIVTKRIKKYDRYEPCDSGMVTIIVKGDNLDPDEVAEFLYNNNINVGNVCGDVGQYFQHSYWKMNPNKTRMRFHINFGYDV